MRMKMENPDKVNNIVQGSLEGLRGIYGFESDRFQRLKKEGIIDRDEQDSIKVNTISILHCIDITF